MNAAESPGIIPTPPAPMVSPAARTRRYKESREQTKKKPNKSIKNDSKDNDDTPHIDEYV